MNSRLAAIVLLVITALCQSRPCPRRVAGVDAARDSLSRGASIAVEDHAADVLLSPDGTFAAGFHGASPTVFTFSVWFARAADRAVVWTAAAAAGARARPVHGVGSRVTLDARRGALVLTDYDGEVVWNSTNGGARARLDDTGNLVVEDAGGRRLWQSFDSPTDTLLPTQRLTAATRLTSRGRVLTAAGYYSMGFSDYAMLSLFYDDGDFASIYWPNPYLNYVANGRRIYNFSRDAAMDEHGQFLASDNANFQAADLGAAGVRRRLTLDTDGNLRVYSFNEPAGTWSVSWMAFSNPCTIHGVCGANAVCLYAPAPVCACAPGHERADAGDWTRGCRPTFRRDDDCARAATTKLVVLPHTDFWGNDLNDGEIMPLRDCAMRCAATCACVAFQHKEQFMECYLKSALFNGRTFPGLAGTVYVKVPADLAVPDSHVHQWHPHGGGLAIDEDIAGCDVAGAETLLLNVSTARRIDPAGKPVWPYMYGFLSALLVVEAVVIASGCWLFSKKGLFRPPRVCAVDEAGRYKLITSQYFRRYTYNDIKKATGNFADVIGGSSSGAAVVYKGVLDDTRAVAVKVLRNVSRRSEEEFQAELRVIGRIYHMNLVRMWGCCCQGRKHRILVSEYIENGSLANMLFHREGSANQLLGWNQRFRIALGVAKGLAYLHSECLEWIIHCDMKPENILLDQDLEPKITDFGLAKLLNRDGSDVKLSRIRGTRGYMAPEWVSSLPITEKVDVYSYGVVLLELVKGVRISEWVIHGVRVSEMDIRMVVKAACEKTGSNEGSFVEDLVDHRLNGDFDCVQVRAMLEIATACLEEDRSERPSMSSVVQALVSVEDKDRSSK